MFRHVRTQRPNAWKRLLTQLVRNLHHSAILAESVEPLDEKARPGMEEWIEHRTPGFKDRYGDAWKAVLYATAWKFHPRKKRKKHKKD